VHIALVTQNADLELDLRPRAEAAALASAGYQVTLGGGTRNPGRLRSITDSRVAIACYPMPHEAAGSLGQVREQGSSFILMTQALRRLSRESPVDVVHASNPPDNVWLALPVLRVAQSSRPRFVFDQHDVAPVLLEEKYGAAPHMKLLASVARGLERRSFTRAALVVFANADYELRARHDNLLSGPSVVVPNGWSLPDAPPRDDWAGGSRYLVAYVGAINEQDCVEHLVEAVSRLSRPEDIRVCVAGDGAARAAAERRAAELGVGQSFRWLGWVRDRAELGSLVRSAHVCVAPEIDSPFNRLASFVKLVEYMSVGAPTVAHRLAQSERVCGETVVYAHDMSHEALARAIELVLGDKELGARLGSQARARFLELIAWETVGAPRLVQAYESVFAG
jgi:glycosyltransferase involved in cell wall biosynthesis